MIERSRAAPAYVDAISTWWLAPALALLLYLAFGYSNTLSEPDLVRMSTALGYGRATGAFTAAGQHYGLAFSFGYYDLMYRLLPSGALPDPDVVAQAMNALGGVFAMLFGLGLSLMLARLLGHATGLFATLAFMASPAMLQFLVSAHPMVGAAAFLFFGCWLVLLACDTASTARAALAYVAAAVAFMIGLCLRGEIALAFPFTAALAMYASTRASDGASNGAKRHWLGRTAACCVALAIAFAVFLILQRPYVDSGGGAIEALLRFIAEFTSIKRVAQGVAVFVLALGFATALACLATAWWQRKAFRPNTALICLCLVLILPSLAFWLTNPRPARHFLFPILGIYIALGALWAARLQDMRHALVAALLLVAVNQLLSEAVRPLIVASYQWSFDSGNRRRAVQQAPLGFFPLDQRANAETEEVFRQEAMALSATDPKRLLFVGDTPFYLISWLVHRHPAYRLSETTLGRFDVLLLEDGDRKIYLIDKYHHWPEDIMPAILAMPEVADFRIYVQPATISRYDKTAVPADRIYRAD